MRSPFSLQGSQAIIAQAACLSTQGLFWLLLQVQHVPKHQSHGTADGGAEVTAGAHPLGVADTPVSCSGCEACAEVLDCYLVEVCAARTDPSSPSLTCTPPTLVQ